MLRNFINRNFVRLPEIANNHISNHIVPTYPYMKELKELIKTYKNPIDPIFYTGNVGGLTVNPFRISNLPATTNIKRNFYTWITSVIFYYNCFVDRNIHGLNDEFPNEKFSYKTFNLKKCLSMIHDDQIGFYLADWLIEPIGPF
jgi:hypothetical protein